jgi:putative FmdB family regulatory protein
MPIYEYQCDKCRKVSSFLVRNVNTHKPPACPKCGHPKMARWLSRFAAPKRGASSHENAPSTTPGPGSMPDMAGLEGLDENDPRSMGRVMRKLAQETGESMPPEMDEMCRRLEAGEDPEKIEAEMGDLGEEGMGPGGADDDTLYDA